MTLLVIAAAVAAVLLTFDLPDWSRWPLVAVAAALGVLVVAAVAVGLLPPTVQRKATTKRGVAAVSVVVLAAAALVFAVLYPEFPGWVRWMLAIVSILLVLAGRAWGQTAWPDIAVASLIALAVAAGIAEAVTEPEPADDPPTVIFELQNDKVTVLEAIEKNGKAILLVVEPTKLADNAPISYESARYPATVSDVLGVGKPSGTVAVTLERGAKDSNAQAFSADLTAATKIYVMSG